MAKALAHLDRFKLVNPDTLADVPQALLIPAPMRHLLAFGVGFIRDSRLAIDGNVNQPVEVSARLWFRQLAARPIPRNEAMRAIRFQKPMEVPEQRNRCRNLRFRDCRARNRQRPIGGRFPFRSWFCSWHDSGFLQVEVCARYSSVSSTAAGALDFATTLNVRPPMTISVVTA